VNENKQATRQQIVDESRTWLGTPFVHQGRLKGVGVDCVGLVVCIAKDLGIYDYDFTGYRVIPNSRVMGKELQDHLTEIPISEIKMGSILWFRVRKEPQHLAIRTDTGIIHAYSPNQTVLEVDFTNPWPSLLYKAFDYKGVTD
jgi:cell wall-associated NlpC family hydrolase